MRKLSKVMSPIASSWNRTVDDFKPMTDAYVIEKHLEDEESFEKSQENTDAVNLPIPYVITKQSPVPAFWEEDLFGYISALGVAISADFITERKECTMIHRARVF